MILKYLRSVMAKVVLINLRDFSHNEIDINLENSLIPIATPLLAALVGKIKNNNFVIISKFISLKLKNNPLTPHKWQKKLTIFLSLIVQLLCPWPQAHCGHFLCLLFTQIIFYFN